MANNVGRRLAQLSKRLDQFEQRVVVIAGEVVHDVLLEELARDTGGDSALSGIGGGKYKLDVELSPLRNPAGVRIRPKKRQSGMWAILSSGTTSHDIAAKERRKHVKKLPRGASRLRAMKPGGQWAVGPFLNVRGSTGKGTWTRAKLRGFDEAIEAIRRSFHEVVADG